MFFCAENLRVDYDARACILTDNPNPTFTWAAKHTKEGASQSAYRICVTDSKTTVWDSGFVPTSEQKAVYAGPSLKSGTYYTATVALKDEDGTTSEACSASFLFVGNKTFSAKWITTPEESKIRAKYFTRDFTVKEKPVSALLYTCGVGYQHLRLNGEAVEQSFLDPAVSRFDKTCYYTVNDVTDSILSGENRLGVAIGNGWREMDHFKTYNPNLERPLFGRTQLLCELCLTYADGSTETVATDETWRCGFGAITENHLFDGETYDGTKAVSGWDRPGFSEQGFTAAILAENLGELLPQTIQPVTAQKRLTAKLIRRFGENSYIYDFGTNIAGVCELKLPENMPVGTTITVEYTEEILPNGDIDRETLRKAKQTDTYIAGEENPKTWNPVFTYHGFRYAKITGYPAIPDESTLIAIAYHNDVRNGSYFRCGSAVVNQIQENIVQTECNNLHHLATDCPQRDERMGWMNDATVRFEETPYNFNMGRMFPKIIRDLVDEQGDDGAITCTAPLVFGNRPADPVSSSFLVMGKQLRMHYGDSKTTELYYENFKKWNECLKSHREDGIVTFSYYGDWAGPADFCNEIFDGAQSAVTPNILMSTGYHFYNYKLLAEMANALGKQDEAEEMLKEAEIVRAAFLKKWFEPKKAKMGYVANGSQGAQAFALWLGILPPESEKLVAYRLHEAVKNVGYRITTGNLTTRYLMDMLAKWGYIDAAWKIMTREEYPSWGYMVQNGATTVWERFENKRGSGMNSHDHPMYGAVGYWLYAYIAGIKPDADGWKHFTIKPYIPTELQYAEACVDTVYGKIYVKWQQHEGGIEYLIDIPFGMSATFTSPDGEKELGTGSHSFRVETR